MNTVNVIESINLLPEWYLRSQRRKSGFRRQVLLITVMVLGMGILWVQTGYRKVRLSHYLASLEQQIDETRGKYTEVDKLKAAHTDLKRQVKIYNQLVRPIGFSEVVGTVSVLTPEEISLTEVAMRTGLIAITRSEKKEEAKKGDSTEDDNYEAIVVEVAGHAPSNVIIANFVGQLASSNLFRSVKMVYSNEGMVGDAITRQFKITMEVPLNCRYVSIGGMEVADAH